MSAAATPSLSALRPGEVRTCGSVDPAGVARVVERLKAKVLTPVCRKLAEKVSELLDEVQRENSRDYVLDCRIPSATENDLVWADKFIYTVCNKIEDNNTSRWEVVIHHIELYEGNLCVSLTVNEKNDSAWDAQEWVNDIVLGDDAARESLAYIGIDTDRAAEDAEVAASGKSASA
jgi:hypothetical protein